MIVTLTGANDLQRRAQLDKLIAAFVAEYTDMAVERYDGEETPAARMRESAASLPFLTSRKLVILREPSRQKAFAESIAEVLDDVADTTDLIIYEPKLDKRSTYYKLLKKNTEFREAAELDAHGLAAWIREYVQEKGGSISGGDAQYLVDRVGMNQQMVRSEIDKLLAYDTTITQATIMALTEPLPASTVFELVDAAFAGRPERAFQLYREQRALRVEPQAILAMLAWQLHVLAVVKAGGNRAAADIAKEAKLNPYVVRKTQGLARALSLQQIRQLVADLLELDMQLKRTAIDADEALQLVLLRLSNR
jgi:DNA polymerase-3 subunit delta